MGVGARHSTFATKQQRPGGGSGRTRVVQYYARALNLPAGSLKHPNSLGSIDCHSFFIHFFAEAKIIG
jgi:hypothetical protein